MFYRYFNLLRAHLRVPGHVGQLQFYLGVLGVENGRLDCVERSILVKGAGEGVNASFPVERDGEMFGKLLERAGTFHGYLAQRETPLREAYWLCRHCLHGNACA